MLSKKSMKDISNQYIIICGVKCFFVDIEGKTHIVINQRVHKLYRTKKNNYTDITILTIIRVCTICKKEFFTQPEEDQYRCGAICTTKFEKRKSCKINKKVTDKLIEERREIKEQSKDLIKKKIVRNRNYKLDGNYMIVEGKKCRIYRMRQKGGICDGKLNKYIKRQCKHCAKEFYTRTTKPGKFCSIACGAKHNKSNFVNKRITNICDEKKKAFSRMRMYRLVASKKIIRPSICSSCGNCDKIIRPHHENYDEIYTVVWLCRSCNCLLQYGHNVKGTTIKYDSNGTILEEISYERNSKCQSMQ